MAEGLDWSPDVFLTKYNFFFYRQIYLCCTLLLESLDKRTRWQIVRHSDQSVTIITVSNWDSQFIIRKPFCQLASQRACIGPLQHNCTQLLVFLPLEWNCEQSCCLPKYVYSCTELCTVQLTFKGREKFNEKEKTNIGSFLNLSLAAYLFILV